MLVNGSGRLVRGETAPQPADVFPGPQT